MSTWKQTKRRNKRKQAEAAAVKRRLEAERPAREAAQAAERRRQEEAQRRIAEMERREAEARNGPTIPPLPRAEETRPRPMRSVRRLQLLSAVALLSMGLGAGTAISED